MEGRIRGFNVATSWRKRVRERASEEGLPHPAICLPLHVPSIPKLGISSPTT